MLLFNVQEYFDNPLSTFWTILANVIAGLILLCIVTKLVYKPLIKVLKKRQDYINATIDKAMQQEAASSQLLIDNQIVIQQKMQTINEFQHQAKLDAEAYRTSLITKTKHECDELLEQHQQEVAELWKTTQLDFKDQVLTTSLLLVTKILNKEIDTTVHQALFKEFIDNIR